MPRNFLRALIATKIIRSSASEATSFIRSYWDLLPGLLLMLGLSGLQILLMGDRVVFAVGMALGGSAIAHLTGAWLNRQLGGHTGDTYGAVVEWTEALLLCLLTAL